MKIAAITGAGQGIGAAVARKLAADGYKLALLDLNASALEEITAELGAFSVPCDIANTDQLVPLVHRIENEVGPIDVLVNSAGICPTRSFFEIDEAIFRKTFDVNVFGLFVLLQAVAASMKARGVGGVIINMASNSAFMPKLEQLDYGASKAAVVSITRSAAASLGPLGIRVNAVAPGVIDTPLTKQIAEKRSSIRGVPPMETLAPVLNALPLRRMGTAEEVADLVAFLASDEARYITGQTFDIDGGQWMR